MITRAHCLEQAAYWQGIGAELSKNGNWYLASFIRYRRRLPSSVERELANGYQRRSAKAHVLASDYLAMAMLMSDTAPYVDSLICYASTLSEHDGNRIARAWRDGY